MPFCLAEHLARIAELRLIRDRLAEATADAGPAGHSMYAGDPFFIEWSSDDE